MIICIDCDRETKKLLDSLLAGGDYEGYSEVISVAIKNLEIIRSAVDTEGSLVIEPKSMPELVHKNSKVDRFKMRVIDDGGSHKRTKFVSAKPPSSPSVPHLFSRPSEESVAPKLMQLPDDRWVMGVNVPLNRWIFAMYNKLLPAKANCRALNNLGKASDNGIPLEFAIEKISQEAVLLGDYLINSDLKLSLNRDLSLATAFPSSTRDVDKSMSRYGNQFVANLNKYGKLSGLLFSLKLINYRRIKKNTFIHLTEPGWRFARMENPVLDVVDLNDIKRFSDDEVDFLLEHISKSVPAEDAAYRAILKLVQVDVNSPDAIDKSLQSLIPQKDKVGLSESYLISQRSGAVSRMSDLDLIRRVRNGVAITYEITSRGVKYLDSNKFNEDIEEINNE